MYNDPVNHPVHYTQYPVEVMDITKCLSFALGNVVKYVLRAPYKNKAEDCQKALKYLEIVQEYAGMNMLYHSDLDDKLHKLITWLYNKAKSGNIYECQMYFLNDLDYLVHTHPISRQSIIDDMTTQINNMLHIFEQQTLREKLHQYFTNLIKFCKKFNRRNL